MGDTPMVDASNGFIALLVWLASLLLGGFLTLSTLMLCLAAMANGSEAYLRRMKLLAAGVAGFGLLCAIVAVLLMFGGHAWWGAVVAMLPGGVMMSLIAVNA